MKTPMPFLVGLLCLASGSEAAVNIENLARSCHEGKLQDCAKLTEALGGYRSSTDKSLEGMKAAIARLPYQTVLSDIAKNRRVFAPFRVAAIDALTDKKLVSELAANADELEPVREAAVRGVDDQELLFKLATSKSEGFAIPYAALNSLTDVARSVELVEALDRPFSALIRIATLPEASLAMTPAARARLEEFAKGAPGLRSSAAKELLAGTKPSRWASLDLKGPVRLTYRGEGVAGASDEHGRTVVRFPPTQLAFMASFKDPFYESKNQLPVSARFENDHCYEIANETANKADGVTWSASIVETACPTGGAR